MSTFILELKFEHATDLCDPQRPGARCDMLCASRAGHKYDLPTLVALHRMRVDSVNLPPDSEGATLGLYMHANLHLDTIVRCAGLQHNHALSATSFKTTICAYMKLCPHPVDAQDRPIQGSIQCTLSHTNCPNDPRASRKGTQWNISGLEKIGIHIHPWQKYNHPLFTGSAWVPQHTRFRETARMIMDAVLHSNNLIKEVIEAPVPAVTRNSQGMSLASTLYAAYCLCIKLKGVSVNLTATAHQVDLLQRWKLYPMPDFTDHQPLLLQPLPQQAQGKSLALHTHSTLLPMPFLTPTLTPCI